MQNTNTKRIKSLDVLRGWCMIAILFFHTQMYYFGADVVPYTLYVPNALALFYFIAGFLALHNKRTIGQSLQRIILRLVLPYIIFTFVLAIVKQTINFGHIDVHNLASVILSGRASWFVAALIIIEVVFLFVRKLCRDNSWLILCLGVAAMVAAYFVQRSPDEISNFAGGIPFAIPPALLGLFFYTLGFLYHRHFLPFIPKPSPVGYVMRERNEDRDKVRRTMIITWCWLICVILIFLFVKIWENLNGYGFLFASLYADPYSLFIIDMLLGCIAFATLFLLLWQDVRPNVRDHSMKSEKVGMYSFMSPAWIGMHCLVFYFFAGAVPLVVSFLLRKVFTFESGTKWFTDMGFWLTFVGVIAITSFIAWIIYRYLPFLIGRKKNENYL